jgi:hypothetical protein
MIRLLGALCAASVSLLLPLRGQVIEFENNGLKYQTLTKSGITIMYAHMPRALHDYAVIQVDIANGSAGPYALRPDDFDYVRPDASSVRASTAQTVVATLMQKGSGSDVIKLMTTYEAMVYGNAHFKSTNGYESRREAALAFGQTKMKAATAAAVLAFAATKLAPHESTDGAVFFATSGKGLEHGRLIVRTNTDVFEFNAE